MLIGPESLGFPAQYQPPPKRSNRLTAWLAPDWLGLMHTLPDAARMCAVAPPALLTRLVRSKGMSRKFRPLVSFAHNTIVSCDKPFDGFIGSDRTNPNDIRNLIYLRLVGRFRQDQSP